MHIPVIQNLIRWSRNHSLPGFGRLPLYDVVVFVYRETGRFDVFTRANSIAFSFFLALFPSIIVLFTLIPYLSDYVLSFFNFTTDTFLGVLQYEISHLLPGEKGVGTQLFNTIFEIAKKPNPDILSIGFFLAIYFASNGMLSMMQSFEKSHLKAFRKRSGLKKRLIAILLTFQIGLLMVGSVILIVLGNLIISYLVPYIKIEYFGTAGLFLLRWGAIIMLIYSGIGIIYRYGMATYHRFSIFSPGATLATILSIFTSLAFSFYVDNYANYSKIYGPIATIVVVMLWIQFNALVILIGFELNASIAVHRDLRLNDGQLEH